MASTANEVFQRSRPQPNNKSNQNWAEIRFAKTANHVSTNRTRLANMGGLANNTTTQPDNYSPFLTPSSFQIPNTRKEIYLWANWWYNNEPKVAAAINFYSNFPFNGWKLECKSSVVKDFFEKLMRKLNFQHWLPLISRSYHLYGDAFVLSAIDCSICNGRNINPKTQKDCDHTGATWKSISLLNPDSVMITPGFMDQEPTYSYLPSDREIKVVMDKNPEYGYDSIPEDVRALISRKAPIKLNPISIHHFKHAADTWSDYGTSIVRPLFVTLAYKDKLRQANWLIAERLIIPVRIVTVGDENRPASQQDLDSVQDQLAMVANDPNLTLVTPHAFKYEFVGASSQILQTTPEHELIDQELLDGLMINKALLNGEGPAYNSAQVGLLSMNERLETWRREVAQWMEEKLFKCIAEWNGFTATGDGGQEELIYPTIVFDDLKLKDNTGTLQMLVTAQQNGTISAETLVENFGLNWDQEVERLRFEQGMNFVNSSEVMNTDMNIGFGGVSGNGFGSGINQPLTPGAPGGMPGSEAPQTPGGPAGAPPPGMPPMPSAETLHKFYKLAADTMNEISFNRTSLASVVDQTFISAIDKELNEKFAVTGRGKVGFIPDDLDPVEPWRLEYIGEPKNYLAQKQVRNAKVKEKQNLHGYTGLEKKLYQIIMSMNIPIAFYAQFEAGPSKEYTLDGAFPDIKLGIEADGEIWHNNPNKLQSDRNRDVTLAQQGWTILRFTDREIEKQAKDVAVVIQQALQKLSAGHQSLFSEMKTFI